MMSEVTYCGFVAIVGRPNVGKSTLLNELVGQQVSITSNKPQTTRQRVLGIHTEGNRQIVFVDTPGLHKHVPHALNRLMNKSVVQAIDGVNAILWVIDWREWTEEDERVLSLLQKQTVPIILVVNKIDLHKNREALLPLLQKLSTKLEFAAVVPVSALKNDNVPAIYKALNPLMPESPFYYPEDECTDASVRFLIAEKVREKLTRELSEELPYDLTVVIEQYEETEKLIKVGALIVVEREGQKAIVIGKKGEVLKKVGRLARLDLEAMLGRKIFLSLWVKVKPGWADNMTELGKLGFDQ